MQSALRAAEPPVARSDGLLIGVTADGEVAAAAWRSFDTPGEQLLIRCLATAVEHRGQGLGRQALRLTVEALERTKARHGMDCGIWARIDRRNQISRLLFADEGFECVGSRPGSHLDTWVRL